MNTHNRTAVERIADMRKCYANSPEPVDHLSDLELAFRELDAAVTNECRVQADYDRELQRQNQWERDVRTAARRDAQDGREAWSKLYMDALLRQATTAITALIYQAKQAGARMATKQLTLLHGYASEAEDMLKRPMDVEELKVAEHWRAEAWRLREFIMAAGRALHAETSTSSGSCYCRGCELIRGMDDVAELTPTTTQPQES